MKWFEVNKARSIWQKRVFTSPRHTAKTEKKKKRGRDGTRMALRDSCISLKSRGRCYSSMLTLVVVFKMVEDLFPSRDFSLFTQRWSRVAAQCEQTI